MKNHIVFKFIAIVLCSCALLTAIGSALGIFAMSEMDLYDQSANELYEEEFDSTRRRFASYAAGYYAALHLGNCPEPFVDGYFGHMGRYNSFLPGYYAYTLKDENGNILEEENTYLDKTEATRYSITVENGSYPVMVQQPQTSEFFDNTLRPVIEPPAQTDSELEVYGYSYYDYEQDSYVECAYYYADMPAYTVELYLLPGAMSTEPAWTLLKMVWNLRNELFTILIVSLLAFAAFAVYLCCAAGKKPGREEIRAGGLNCIPLDLYAAGTVFAIWIAVLMAYEAFMYLFRENPIVAIYFVVLGAYGCCLLFVSFCFACAAQFKTPGGYWWRHSVIGWVIMLSCRVLLWCWKCFVKVCRWLWEKLPKALGAIGSGIKAIFLWLVSLVKRGWALLLVVVQKLWEIAVKLVNFIFRQLGRFFKWTGRTMNRLYSLLPLTWQWLVTGFVMTMMLYIALRSYRTGWLLVGFGLFFGIILYGANAFGILMESAKRMSKGDLETKVSDQFLVGSFKEFAGDLNALADVAVVAAQKQMKSERMKAELVTNVSHDIKTPLTSIINYVDLLQKAQTPEEREQYLEVLDRQSHRMKKLIDDLMEMSKASTGNLTVEIRQVDAVEAVNQALGEFADKLANADLTPIFAQPEKPAMMLADGRLAWRVLSNLLSNAVKYALPGTRLYIDLVELEGKVLISLKNISREQLNVSSEELMERFVRGDASRNTEGSGLGLNIAKSLMDLQHGQLQLLVDGDLFKATLIFPQAK